MPQKITAESILFSCWLNLTYDNLCNVQDYYPLPITSLPTTMATTLHTPQYPLPTIHYTLLVRVVDLPTVHFPLSSAHCHLPTVICPLSSAHCLLATVHCPSVSIIKMFRYDMVRFRKLVKTQYATRNTMASTMLYSYINHTTTGI